MANHGGGTGDAGTADERVEPAAAGRWMGRIGAGLSRDSFLLAVTSFFADISSEMLYPLIPTVLTATLGAPATVLGLVEGVAQGTQNIVQGFSGWLADRLGHRKRLAVVGYALAAATKPFMGLAGSWPGFLGARFADRLGTGIRSAPRDALIAASAAPGARGKAFGLETAGDNLGAVSGPLIAMALVGGLGLSLRSVFCWAGAAGALAVLTVLLVRDRPTGPAAPRSAAPAPLREAALGALPPRFWYYLGATAIFGLGNSSDTFLILRAGTLGLNETRRLLAYTGYNAVAALLAWPIGSLSDRVGRRVVLVEALGVFAVTYLGFARATAGWWMWGLFPLYGIFGASYRGVGKALAGDCAGPTLRATALGLFATTVGLSGIIASVVAGVLWDRVGPGAVFLWGAASAALGAAALLGLPRGSPATEA